MLSFLWGVLRYRKLGVKEEIFFPRMYCDQTDHNTFEALLPKHYHLIFSHEKGLFPCGSMGVPERAVIPFVVSLSIARLRCWCQTKDYMHILQCSVKFMWSQ